MSEQNRVNLPNAITAARIAVAPIIAFLPFSASPTLRFLAFVLFVTAAVTDVFDGWLARSQNMVTDLGRLLDPLADKLLLAATFIPMFVLMAPDGDPVARMFGLSDGRHQLPFDTPLGTVGIPWWVVAVILAREVVMTIFRQVAARRGLVIAANSLGKWKTGFQSTWIGASYFWFFAATVNSVGAWSGVSWEIVSLFVGTVGLVTMVAAFGLTVYSLWSYLVTHWRVLR